MSTKSITDSEFLVFPSVKFLETWQTGSKCFTLVGVGFFQGNLKDQFFGSGIKAINLQKSKKCLYELYFSVFRIPLDAMCCETDFGRFHRRKFKIVTNNPYQKVKTTFVWEFI